MEGEMNIFIDWLRENMGEEYGSMPVAILSLDVGEEYDFGFGPWKLLGFCEGEREEWMMVGRYKIWNVKYILDEVMAIPQVDPLYV
jgi:hypothetical protein